MPEIIGCYIRDHRGMFTVYLIDKGCWTVDCVSGQCAGRLQRENLFGYSYAPGWSLVISRKLLKAYALEIGVSENHLKQLLNNPRIKSKYLYVVKKGRAVRCYVIPLDGEPNLSAIHHENAEESSKCAAWVKRGFTHLPIFKT